MTITQRTEVLRLLANIATGAAQLRGEIKDSRPEMIDREATEKLISDLRSAHKTLDASIPWETLAEAQS